MVRANRIHVVWFCGIKDEGRDSMGAFCQGDFATQAHLLPDSPDLLHLDSTKSLRLINFRA